MTRTDGEPSALLTAELDRFVRVVSAEMDPDQIILFGSLVNGHVHEWSDLDLVVVAETDLPYFDRFKRIDEQLFPRRVAMDVFIYTPEEWEQLSETRPFMRDEVVANGRVVYARDAAEPPRTPIRRLKEKMRDPAEDWVDRAHRNLEAAQALYGARLWAEACFHAQQCVEVAFKAAITHSGVTPPRTHSTEQLLGHLPASLQAAMQPFVANLPTLDKYYTGARYPDAQQQALPAGLPGQSEAKDALAVASDALRIVETTLFPGRLPPASS